MPLKKRKSFRGRFRILQQWIPQRILHLLRTSSWRVSGMYRRAMNGANHTSRNLSKDFRQVVIFLEDI